MGTSDFKGSLKEKIRGGKPRVVLASHHGEVEIFLVHSCFGKRDKLRSLPDFKTEAQALERNKESVRALEITLFKCFGLF